MSNTAVAGVDPWGGRSRAWIGDHTGPTSYTAGGELLSQSSAFGGANAFGLAGFNWIDGMGLSVSGNYYVEGQLPGSGVRMSAYLRWFYSGLAGQGVNGVVIASAGSGQTNGTYTVNASTGAATIQVTIAGGAITAVKVLNPGSGYTSVPTFTISEGGTPGTVTATVGNTSGIEVAPGTNLSGETVRLLVIGG